MRFLRVGEPGAERPAVEEGGRVFDISVVTPDLDGSFRRLGPPIARPAAVLCIGQNYAAHAAESGSSPPEFPIIFFKHPNTVVGPFDDICRPPGAQKLDWEVELGVVIGRRARYLVPADVPAPSTAGAS